MEHGTGAIKDKFDSRDYQWGEELGHGSMPFDWVKGYDVEEELGFKLPVKDQNGSSSCGGQAWSYYGQVLDFFIDKVSQEKSAKFIYAQTVAPGGGSAGRTNCELCVKQGWGNELDCSSYESGTAPTEGFMTRINDITALARENALKDKAFSYANVALDADLIAQAVRDNHGLIIGITGKNNGTWTSATPTHPDNWDNTWNHWVYVGKCKTSNGKKYFGLLNSWGKDVGVDGWQWISEDYINARCNGYPFIWNLWTMVAKQNDATMVVPLTKLLKYGMTDSEVKILQVLLKKSGEFPNINTTHYFGSITLNAVKAFQKKYGLKPDGIVGPLTRDVINKLI
jgi:hypothetical protein